MGVFHILSAGKTGHPPMEGTAKESVANATWTSSIAKKERITLIDLHMLEIITEPPDSYITGYAIIIIPQIYDRRSDRYHATLLIDDPQYGMTIFFVNSICHYGSPFCTPFILLRESGRWIIRFQ